MPGKDVIYVNRVVLGLFLLALAPMAFAQNECKQSCCQTSGGSWNYDFQSCDPPSSSYYQCISQCSSGLNCCGAAFLLASVGVGALLAKKG